MADAHLPQDAEDEEGAPSAPASLHATASAMVDGNATENTSNVAGESVILLPPPPRPMNISAPDAVIEVAPSDNATGDEPQGMSASDQSDGEEVAPAAAATNEPEPAPAPSADTAPPGPEPEGDADAVDSPAEISPIFSAIDAAERAAQQPPPPPQLDAFEVGLVVSSQAAPAEGEDSEMPAPPDEIAPQEPAALATAEHALHESASPAPPWAPAAEPPAPPPEDPFLEVDDVPADTAVKIAEEANATAVALEALKQLLAERLPELEAAAARHAAQVAAPGGAPSLGTLGSLHAPVSPPPMVPAHVAALALPYARSEPPRRRGSIIGSFLAGFSLSWVVGAVLYMFLTAG